MPTGRRPKYQPLADYLAAQTGNEVTLTFAEIEALVGAPLPQTAMKTAFWVNRRSAWGMPGQARAWAAAGWRVGTVLLSLASPTVTFIRAGVDSTPSPAGRPRPTPPASARQRRRPGTPIAEG